MVEAVEGEGTAFLLGIQWHPEDLPDHPATRAIFNAFIHAAAQFSR